MSGSAPACTATVYCKVTYYVSCHMWTSRASRSWCLGIDMLGLEGRRVRGAGGVRVRHACVLAPHMLIYRSIARFFPLSLPPSPPPSFSLSLSRLRLSLAHLSPSPLAHLSPSPLSLLRTHAHTDSFEELNRMGAHLKRTIQIEFVNHEGLTEAGIDGGGLFKEFLNAMAAQVWRLCGSCACTGTPSRVRSRP